MRTISMFTYAAALCCIVASATHAQLTVSSVRPPAFNASAPRLSISLVLPDTQERPRAVMHSDFYYVRLKIHRIGSYAIFPLFAAQYYVGDRLLNADNPPSWAKGTHGALAGGVAGLFGVNTVTGLWNLWDSRNESTGRLRKYLHTALMLGADAGFVWTAQTADGAGRRSEGGRHHRNVALAAVGASAAATVMMWLWQ
jgi:hypothetical protein